MNMAHKSLDIFQLKIVPAVLWISFIELPNKALELKATSPIYCGHSLGPTLYSYNNFYLF